MCAKRLRPSGRLKSEVGCVPPDAPDDEDYVRIESEWSRPLPPPGPRGEVWGLLPEADEELTHDSDDSIIHSHIPDDRAACSLRRGECAGAGECAAQIVKPFRITGEGIGPFGLPLPGQDPRPHWIIGEATHLGRHYGEGTVQTDSAAFDPETGQIVGQFGSGSPFVFVGASGDRLVTWYGRQDHGASEPGRIALTILGATAEGDPIVEAWWIAEFVAVPEESTGKFAGVTGSWIMLARSEPFVLGSDDPVHYSWEGEGRLTFRRGR